MIPALVAFGLLSVPPTALVPKTTPTPPVTEVYVRGGVVVAVGKDFEATAAHISISPDGKRLELRGTPGEPATFVRTSGTQRTAMSGERIVYWPAENKFLVDGSGRITETTRPAK